MYSVTQHLDNLIRYISLVRENCIVIGKKLIAAGQIDFGRLLIAKGFEHDVSKFYGVEWDFLHTGPDTDKEKMSLAVHQHVRTNQHHPEYWGGIADMPPIAIAEMVADWGARSQEFGTSLKDWVTNVAITKYSINIESEEYRLIMKFIQLLTEDSFVK